MKYAKIIIKSDYEKKGDLVLRSYIRALKKINATILLDGDKGLIYGLVDKYGQFHELFTKKVIDYDDYCNATVDEFVNLSLLPAEKKELLRKVNERVLFNQDNDLDIEISTIEDLAKDRFIEFNAYNSFLSRINPYQKLGENINQGDECNDFLHKLEAIKIIKLQDSYITEPDAYEVNEYIRREKEEDFDIVKVLKK